MQPIHYVIIVTVLIIIFLAVIRANSKDFKLEINKLVEYLGGKDNIIDTEVEMSRFKVTLKDVTKANKEGIMKLGAKGVVEIEDQLKIIFGKDAKKLKKYIDELKNLLDGTNVISNIHYSNDLIDDNGMKYENPYFSKWEQIDSFIKDNRYIKNLYYAEDSVINVKILEEIMNEKYSDINYIKFIPGTDVHDTNTFCSDKKGIDALLSIINEYMESKNKKEL